MADTRIHAIGLVLVLAWTAQATAEGAKGAGPETPKAGDGPSCELLTQEAPAGGRLEIRGARMGKSPLVKIGGKVARLIQRQGDTLAVQIDKRSKGGPVTLLADRKTATCGTLTIIGAN